MIEASQGVKENRILEEVLEIHLKMVKEVQDDAHNLAGMMVKETKDNCHEIEEMKIDQDQEIGEIHYHEMYWMKVQRLCLYEEGLTIKNIECQSGGTRKEVPL